MRAVVLPFHMTKINFTLIKMLNTKNNINRELKRNIINVLMLFLKIPISINLYPRNTEICKGKHILQRCL